MKIVRCILLYNQIKPTTIMESMNKKLIDLKIPASQASMPNHNRSASEQDRDINVSGAHNPLVEEVQLESQSPSKEYRNNSPASSTNAVLITANLGSVFEDPGRLMPIWTSQFDDFLKRIDPGFVAIHCQEVGGKDSAEGHNYVREFVECIKEIGKKSGYSKFVAFFDQDYECKERYTALGCIYLIHSTVTDLELYNFQKKEFSPIMASIVHCGCIDGINLVEKEKFPLKYFPTSRWSRKGYLRTRWRLNNAACKNGAKNKINAKRTNNMEGACIDTNVQKITTTFELINIHLFHDADNLTSFNTFPSPFANCREKALQYTLSKTGEGNTTSDTLPFFIFGDFNFRLNAHKVIEKLVTDSSKSKNASHPLSQSSSTIRPEYSVQDSGEDICIYKERLSDDVVLSLGKKEFNLSVPDNNIFSTCWELWKTCDFETDSIQDTIFEFPLNFPPTYPYEENPDIFGNNQKYMKTRCPAWCDRVLVSKVALNKLVCVDEIRNDGIRCNFQDKFGRKEEIGKEVKYNVIGSEVCMGDHKPVYLSFRLHHGADQKENCITDVNSVSQDDNCTKGCYANNPGKFPRIESPTYMDLLKDTDFATSFSAKKSMEKPMHSPDHYAKALTTSSESPNTKILNGTYVYKETTV